MTFLLSYISLAVLAMTSNKQVECQRVQLNMYEDSFDDQYFGCIEGMESILPELLKKERSENAHFNSAWESAVNIWQAKISSLKALPQGFRDEHGVALLTYTNISSPVYKQLNQEIREYGVAPQNFKYHSLHFYLTRAIALLRTSCNGDPLYTYRGMSKVQFEPPVGLEQNIRLSQFSSSSTDIKEAEKFGNASFFRITTCYGIDIQSFSYFPSQKEVLIPVDEVFRVTSYAKDGNKFILTSTNQRCSFYNCDYLGGAKREVCTYNSAPVTLFPGPLASTLFVGLVIIVATIPA